MKIYPVFLLMIAASTLRADIPAGWSTDYPGTLSAAASKQRPALVFFTASWCGPCKLMSRVTLADARVQQGIAGIEHVAVDIDAHPDLASKYGVNAVPTFVMLSAGEDEVERTTGYEATGDFMQWLTAGVAEAQDVMIRKAVAKKDLGDVDQLLVSTGSDSLQEAAVKLFDLCDERDAAIVKEAAERLKAIASRAPSVLLDGLDDARLATRIQVANVLGAKIGDLFDVDPWSDAATREKKIRAWRQQLAGGAGKPGG